MLTRIALDAMGGDAGPAPIVEGAVQAAAEFKVEIILVGDEGLIEKEIKRHSIKDLPLSVIHAPQRVEMGEPPSQVIRRKRQSSIWMATELVKEGKAEAVISAGNTGATMASALFILGPLQGIERPAIAALLPTLIGNSIMLDVGATVDCKPVNLLQFAVMGHEYAKREFGKASPKIGLLSIGEEDSKGNELTKETFKLLKSSSLNFIGNVEGSDVYAGHTDVVVCDGFIGNVALKISEGLADTISKLLKREIAVAPLGKLGYFFLKSRFKQFRRRVDYAEYGGAPLLGVNGICIISHGRSSAKAIKNAIKVATDFSKHRINEHIQKNVEENMASIRVKELSEA
jgi:glycerol-3-phosphate acyltransferase PlsX